MRYLIVASLFVLSLITYIDRAAISSAKTPMAAELGLSDQAMGAVFGAFALGYALAQVPSGWFADRFGPRLALSTVVTIWSLFTGRQARCGHERLADGPAVRRRRGRAFSAERGPSSNFLRASGAE
jgi:MFS family permease